MYKHWKWYKTPDGQPGYSIIIPRFFADGASITCKIASQKGEDTSILQLYKGQRLIQTFIEPQYLDSAYLGPSPQSAYVEDINGEGLRDLKILIPDNGGAGAYNFYLRVIYLFQKKNQTFTKVSFDDLMMDYRNRPERDFDGDGHFEIITQTFENYRHHNYWAFNLYDFNGTGLVNVNSKGNYPILIQLLERDNYSITHKMSRSEMKKFAMELPDRYDKR